MCFLLQAVRREQAGEFDGWLRSLRFALSRTGNGRAEKRHVDGKLLLMAGSRDSHFEQELFASTSAESFSWHFASAAQALSMATHSLGLSRPRGGLGLAAACLCPPPC